MEERIITPIDRDKHEDFPPLIFRETIDSSKVRNFTIKTKIFR